MSLVRPCPQQEVDVFAEKKGAILELPLSRFLGEVHVFNIDFDCMYTFAEKKIIGIRLLVPLIN